MIQHVPKYPTREECLGYLDEIGEWGAWRSIIREVTERAIGEWEFLEYVATLPPGTPWNLFWGMGTELLWTAAGWWPGD